MISQNGCMHEHINTQTDRIPGMSSTQWPTFKVCCSDAAKFDLASGFMNWLSGFNQAWKWLEVTPCEKSRYWLYELYSLQKPSLQRANLLYRVCWHKPRHFVVMMMILMSMYLFAIVSGAKDSKLTEAWAILHLSIIYLSMEIRLHVSFRLHQQHLSYIQLD